MSDYSSNYNNQSAALLKARQVAAKLQLAGPNKRQHDDDDNEPHSKRFSGSNSSMSPANLQAQQAAAQIAARLGQPNNYQQNTIPNPEAVEKAKQLINKFIPQTQSSGGGMGASVGNPNPPSARPGLGANNFTEIMIPGPKVGLIIGKKGETIKQLQERTGAKMVVIQDGPGQEMEKPLRISGDPQKVEHAKQLVFELIQDKGGESQPQNNRNNNYNNNRGQDHQGYGGGGGGGGGNNSNGGDQIEVFVPKVAVGVVIGKSGDMIKKIQADTGCRLQFLQTKGDGPGDRRCILQGTKQQVDDGKRMIEDLIDSVLRRNGGGGGGGGNDNWNSNGGNNSNSGYQQQQQHPQQSNQSQMGGGVQVVQHQYQFVVPASKCGIIIGRNGDTIKSINQQSGAHCEMDRKTSQNQTNEKTFTIKGEQHQVEEAKRLIQDKINMDIDLQHIGTSTVTQNSNSFGQNSQNPYQSWGASAGYQGWDQNQSSQMPGAPSGNANQPDYSLQWIEYYRSMGMHQQADAIEAQIKSRQGGIIPGTGQPAPQPAPQMASSGGDSSSKDYSAEWAAYYRSIGKIDEAEAIERSIKGGAQAASSGSTYPNSASAGGNFNQYGQQYGGNYQQHQYSQYGAPQNNSNNDKNW